MAAATRCGACEMSATQRSWAAGSALTGIAPQARTSSMTAWLTCARGLGQRAQRPAAAEEQVRAGRGRAVLLPAGQRMPGT